MVEEPSKKFAVGDMPPSPTTSNPISSSANAHKKPTRHHVKRRSSGRVHVTKLAPMAKAYIQQTTTEDDDNFEDIDQQQQHAPRKPMKRSHSSKSIHRLSSNDPHRKVNLSGFTMTSKPTAPSSANNTTHNSPPITPTEIQPQHKQKQKQKQQSATSIQPVIDNDSTSTSYTDTNSGQPSSATPVPPNHQYQQKSKPLTSPSFQVSHQSPAAPIAHILNATANTLVTPDKPAIANLATSNTSATTGSSNDTSHSNNTSKSKHLYSRFVDQVDRQQDSSTEGRQQRYHHHQQQQQHHQNQYHKQQQNSHHQQRQSIPNSDNDIAYSNLAIVSDTVNKEYESIQVYRDPMGASLSRCIQQKQQQRRQSTMTRPASTSTQLHLHRLAQMGAQQRTFSSSILPTMASLSLSPTPVDPPASDHRQLARQRHQRLLQANNISSTNHPYSSSSITASSTDNKQIGSRWSAGAFLDRVFYGVS